MEPVATMRTSRQTPISLSGGMGAQSTSVMARSCGCGGKTSIASALLSPGFAAEATSNRNNRQVPANCSDVATCKPFIHTLARKLTPSNSSHSVFPLYSAGSLNSVRYHHDCRNGLEGGIWMLEKSSNTG